MSRAGQGTTASSSGHSHWVCWRRGGSTAPHLPRSGLSSAAALAAGPRRHPLQQDGWVSEHELQQAPQRAASTAARDQAWLLPLPTGQRVAPLLPPQLTLWAGGCHWPQLSGGERKRGAPARGEPLPRVSCAPTPHPTAARGAATPTAGWEPRG